MVSNRGAAPPGPGKSSDRPAAAENDGLGSCPRRRVALWCRQDHEIMKARMTCDRLVQKGGGRPEAFRCHLDAGGRGKARKLLQQPRRMGVACLFRGPDLVAEMKDRLRQLVLHLRNFDFDARAGEARPQMARHRQRGPEVALVHRIGIGRQRQEDVHSGGAG